MNADAELDAAVLRQTGVALGQAMLHLDRATQGVDHAAVRLEMRPWCTAMVGSMRSLRSALSRANVRSSSAPASRETPEAENHWLIAGSRGLSSMAC